MEQYFRGDAGAAQQGRDGAGTGGDIFKLAGLLALLFVGLSVLLTSI